MTYYEAFHKAYLLQQKITDLSQDCGVDHAFLKLLDETEAYWVLKNEGEDITWLEVIWKPDATRLESMELPR